MKNLTLSRTTLAAGATLIAAGGLLLAGCGSSSSDTSSTTSSRASAAAQEVALTPVNAGTPVIKQQVSSAVGETVVYSVACNTASTGDVWKSGRAVPNITKKSTTVSVPPGCVTPDGAAPGAPGVRKWAFEATAAGTETISFSLFNAARNTVLKRAAVVLTVTG